MVTFYIGGGFLILLDSATELRDNSETTFFFTGTAASPTLAPNVYPGQYEYYDHGGGTKVGTQNRSKPFGGHDTAGGCGYPPTWLCGGRFNAWRQGSFR
jgi:hypothetical protein